jgi:hypothetical protein
VRGDATVIGVEHHNGVVNHEMRQRVNAHGFEELCVCHGPWVDLRAEAVYEVVENVDAGLVREQVDGLSDNPVTSLTEPLAQLLQNEEGNPKL